MFTNSQKNTNEISQTLDKAFLNSMLSYGAYSEREWLVDDVKNHSDGKSFLASSKLNENTNVNLKKAYEVFLNLFNRETFERVELNIPPNGKAKFKDELCDYSFSKGHYESLNKMSKAIVYKSRNNDGTETLHLAFRGTDTNVRNIFDYTLQAYADMAEYYETFKPLEQAVLAYAKDPKNNISSLQVSGHSLGGAMVQAFFNSPEVKQSNINMEGFTYGAPGAKKSILYKMLPDMIRCLNGIGAIGLGAKLYKYAKEESYIDNRITQFTHSGDLVPKIGGLFYDTIGEQIKLDDTASKKTQDNGILNKESINYDLSYSNKPKRGRLIKMKQMIYGHQETFLSKVKNFFLNRITFKHHDMLRYTLNLENESRDFLVKNNLQTDEQFSKDNMPNIHKFYTFRQKFTWAVSSTQGSDIFTRNMMQHHRQKMAADGSIIYKMPENVQKRMAESRKKAFADKISNLAVTGLKPI